MLLTIVNKAVLTSSEVIPFATLWLISKHIIILLLRFAIMHSYCMKLLQTIRIYQKSSVTIIIISVHNATSMFSVWICGSDYPTILEHTRAPLEIELNAYHCATSRVTWQLQHTNYNNIYLPLEWLWNKKVEHVAGPTHVSATPTAENIVILETPPLFPSTKIDHPSTRWKN